MIARPVELYRLLEVRVPLCVWALFGWTLRPVDTSLLMNCATRDIKGVVFVYSQPFRPALPSIKQVDGLGPLRCLFLDTCAKYRFDSLSVLIELELTSCRI